MLAGINGFDRSNLKSTATRVTSIAGKTTIECKNADGSFAVLANPNEGSRAVDNGAFFVVDTKPDQQLHLVMKGLYIGSQDAAANKNGLKAAGITTVLNCATGIQNSYPEELKYHNIEVLDVPESPIAHHFAAACTAIHEAIGSGGAVLVHCNAGISRSSTIVLSYMIAHHNLSLSEAMVMLKNARACARPNEGFMKQLAQWEAQHLQAKPEL